FTRLCFLVRIDHGTELLSKLRREVGVARDEDAVERPLDIVAPLTGRIRRQFSAEPSPRNSLPTPQSLTAQSTEPVFEAIVVASTKVLEQLELLDELFDVEEALCKVGAAIQCAGSNRSGFSKALDDLVYLSFPVERISSPRRIEIPMRHE